ncbi:hypothetical protein LT493_12770 [Streptomyces tricolor]|nr:hypothetical protein [Streptomyces tricolor]
MKNSTFRTIVKTKSYTAKTITKTGSTRTMKTWKNTNGLLGSYSGTIGVKTGSGPEASTAWSSPRPGNGKTVIGTVPPPPPSPSVRPTRRSSSTTASAKLG